MGIEFRLLGPPELRLDGVAAPLGAPKQRTMLVALLLGANRVVTLDRLIDAIWERPPRSAIANVRTYATGLRRTLESADGGARLVAANSGYLLTVNPGELDLHRFDDLVLAGRAALANGAANAAAERLDAALALWRGGAAEGAPRGPALAAELDILDERRLGALEDSVEARLALGDHAAMLGPLRRMVAEHPLRERAWAQLMLALYRAGDAAAALAAFTDARSALVDRLGIEPGADLARLQAAILRRDKALAAPAPPSLGPAGSPAGPRAGWPAGSPDAPRAGWPTGWPAGSPDAPPLGLLPPAGPPQEPAPRSPAMPAGSEPPRQLPQDVVTFVGRGSELAEIQALLDAHPGGAPPTVAVHGPGGTGKSALAIRAAHAVAHRFPDGQLCVDLHGAKAGLQPLDPGEVLGRFLRALGVPGDAIPGDRDEAAALYRTRTAHRAMLILLDNAVDPAQVRLLLPASPRSAVIVTSRRMLATLEGASHLPLEPLPEPDAVAMLARTAGAGRVAAEPDAAAAIARLCGNLPLALRIAGARLASQPARPLITLANRLGDERRRLDELNIDDLGIRASFEVSYRALSDSDRPGDRTAARAFGLLSTVRAPEISLTVAAALLGAPTATASAVLSRLVEARLVESPAPGRYWTHDLLRLFAEERAREDGGAAAEAERALIRALACYLGTARRAADRLRPAKRTLGTEFAEDPGVERLDFDDRTAALAWFEAERPNLIAVARDTAGRADTAGRFPMRLPTVMNPFLPMRGYWRDFGDLAGLAVDVAQRFGDRHAEASALIARAWADQRAGRLDDALDALEQALTIRLAAGDRHNAASALDHLGLLHERRREPERAIARFEQARAWLREFGNQSGIGINLTNSAKVYLQVGRRSDALAALEESLAIRRASGERLGEAATLVTLSLAYCQLGRYDDALAQVERGLPICRETGAREYHWHALVIRAVAGHCNGRPPDAVVADLDRALSICREVSERDGETLVLRLLARVRRASGEERRTEAADRQAAPSAGSALSVGGGLDALLDHVILEPAK